MRGFYDKLLEALELISAPPAEGAPHGAAQGEEEKAKMSALLTMLREIVRIAAVVPMSLAAPPLASLSRVATIG